MTETEKKICGVCGNEAEYEVAVLRNAGIADLDLRPSPPMRDELALQMQQCSKCGYCVADVSMKREGMEELVKSAAYRAILDQPGRPPLVNQFLAAAHLAEKSGVIQTAAHLAVRAAWAADDAGEVGVAKSCRLNAVELLEKQPWDGAGHQEALMTDLLRRAGEFTRAKAVCERGLHLTRDRIVQRVLELENRLIDAQDTGVHRLDEVVG